MRSAPATSMRDAAASVMQLWDGVVERVERLERDDWSRPTPDRDMDVRALVVHLTTTLSPHRPTTSTEVLLSQLRATRDAQAERLSALATAAARAQRAGPGATRDQRLLRASCLDMFVHAHDLSIALGEEPALQDSPAATEACRYLLPMLGHLLETRADVEPADPVRLDVTGLSRWPPPGLDAELAPDVVVTPPALVLLLSGRGDPDAWRRAGALAWSGASGESFVRRTRLLG